MRDILSVVFPLICAVIGIVFLIVFLIWKGKNKNNTEDEYLSFKIIGSMCICVVIGGAFSLIFGNIAFSYGISFGILSGVLIGAIGIFKKKNNKDKK